MTTPFYCIIAALALVYLPRFWVVNEARKLPGGYDNRDPRAQQAMLTGIGKRAQSAHQNAIEVFAPFAASVFVAHLGGANAKWAAMLSIAFVALRTLYLFLYLGDLPTARSATWSLAIGCVGGLMFLPLLR